MRTEPSQTREPLAAEARWVVLLVSRDAALAESTREVVDGVGQLAQRVVPTAADAGPWLAHDRLALVLVHLAGGGDGTDAAGLLQAANARPVPVATVAVGESGRAEEGLALLQLGAADYLERPADLRRLAMLVDVLTVRARRLPPAPVPDPEPAVACQTSDGPFVYAPAGEMGRMMDQVRRVAPVDTTVLIQGETGTGKTRLARVIHDLSGRAGPFMVVNCAALSASLIESELFGHVKGAFTGADRDRVGKFADAADGTLVLDEVDSLPPELQAKLLRVVEDRVFEPVGSNKSLPMRARLIAAGNRPLDREVEAGKFRADLFFRLNVVTFRVPALRERQAQVLTAMVERFVAEFAGRAGRLIPGLTPDARDALEQYNWPGNVRELRNAVERAVALRPEGLIELNDLPDAVRAGARPPVSQPPPAASLAEAKDAAEAARIATALRKNRNNRLKAAAELGISRMTLYKKLHRYGLFDAAF